MAMADDRYCYVRTEVSGHVAILVVSRPTCVGLKPMTAEVLQTIRDQSALLFRCLYNISGEKKALDLATHFFFE
ncbi:hypothetical protein PI124_g12025 [Phytophthora idaei]|nr:hypothetical protein PI124_g12025 [Phytophthora idaei]